MADFYSPNVSEPELSPGQWLEQTTFGYGIRHPCFGAPPDPDVIEVDNDSESLDLCRKNLIVNYLPQFYTDNHLYELFIPFGPLHSVKIMRDSKMDEDAQAARNGLNGANIANKRLKVSFARPSCDEIKDSNVYVRNLPLTITDEQFCEMFGKFGIIVQKKLLKDKKSGFPRGTAFVRFANRDQAAAAISYMNHFIPPGCVSELRCKLAQDHGRQKAAYIAGYQDATKLFSDSHSESQSPIDEVIAGISPQ